MECNRFLSLLAAGIGLVGALFLSRAVVVLSPKVMLHLTAPYSRIGYAPEQIASMAAQKADAQIGVFCILLAFVIQVGSLILVEENTAFTSTRWMGVWVAIAIVAVLTVFFSFLNPTMRDRNKLEVGQVAVKEYCEDKITGMVDPVNADSLGQMAEQLINLKKEDSESSIDFINRISEYVGYSIPAETDFSRIEDDKSKR